MEDNQINTSDNLLVQPNAIEVATKKDIQELKVAVNKSLKELIRLYQELKVRVAKLEPKSELKVESPNTAAAREYELSAEVHNLKSIARNRDLDPQYITRAKERLLDLGFDPEEE